jgi:gamma-glutamyl-gamma-aminobutyrate hydrolase PuuD
MKALLIESLVISAVFGWQTDPNFRSVGILTMPPADSDNVGHGHYITEMGDIFMRSGGLFPVYIPYNMSDADLYPLLDKVNGVFFTGGDLDLYNESTGELHPYTITSLKILNYAKKQTDSGDYFPLLGICQGLELLHILVANHTGALGWSLLEN